MNEVFIIGTVMRVPDLEGKIPFQIIHDKRLVNIEVKGELRKKLVENLKIDMIVGIRGHIDIKSASNIAIAADKVSFLTSKEK